VSSGCDCVPGGAGEAAIGAAQVRLAIVGPGLARNDRRPAVVRAGCEASLVTASSGRSMSTPYSNLAPARN
jgi:hypothetical protein